MNHTTQAPNKIDGRILLKHSQQVNTGIVYTESDTIILVDGKLGSVSLIFM